MSLVVAALAVDLLCLTSGKAPHYPPPGAPPFAVASHSAAEVAGASCFEKSASGDLWITVAGITRASVTPNAMVARFGALSQLLAARYWSVTEHQWRPLVLSAAALTAASSAQTRADFAPTELSSAGDRYYSITDSRSKQPIAYRLHLWPTQPGRLVVDTANVEPIKRWGLTFYAVNGVRTVYLLEEVSPGVWSYYSVTHVVPNTLLAEGHEKSYINRAVALYRHYMRLPTDAEPPAAP